MSTNSWGDCEQSVMVVEVYVVSSHSVSVCRLEESGVLTDCSIQTQDADEVLDFDFCSSNVVNRVILKADCLREVFAELDMSSDSLEILLSPSPPFCRLSTCGYAGTTQVIPVYMCIIFSNVSS